MSHVTQLGYMVFGVSSLAAWETFGAEVLGLEVASRGDDGSFSLRHDGHAHRFFVEPDPIDDALAIGWETADEASLDALAARLAEAGVDVVPGSPELCARRHVAKLYRFVDPAGMPSEIYAGPELATSPFGSKVVRSGFVADEQGLGHCVVYAKDLEVSKRFYENLLGFRLSDFIRCDLFGYKVDIAFYHANGRHHTVALGEGGAKRIHHFMLETRSIDDVGLALDRTLRARLKLMQTIGRHPNDKMVSFYAETPSGFQFELGTGGRVVDDATWEPTTYDHVSEWGHHRPEQLLPRKPKA